MSRPGLAAGILPERVGVEGELRRLRSEAASARRTWEQRHNHNNEIALAFADQRVIDFLIAHPELAERP